jgi:asparagine synthase (glutamine-hydrolysing)
MSQRPAFECEAIVRTMIRSMVHEEFYCSGTKSAPELGIYAGWVALEDSFAAKQPFPDPEGNVDTVFSGEHFGEQLEPLVELYRKYGVEFVSNLNGLFSGLLIDRQKRAAFLFNDRFGLERIYFHQEGDELYFASEAKALLRVLPELRAFDEEGVTQFLAFGCTLEWRTVFRNVGLMPGGSLWRVEEGRMQKTRYFSPGAWEEQEPLSGEDFEIAFDRTFKRILPRYFECDSEIGISLTGGLDTRMIMAARSGTEDKCICYTFGGNQYRTLDARLAKRVAGTCGLDHRDLAIDTGFFADFSTYADRTIYITDGCCGIIGAHEIYLNRKARRLAPVRLTGNFGSEVLRSMSTFKPIQLSPELLNNKLFSQINPLQTQTADFSNHPVSFAAFKEIPWNLFGSLAAGRSQVAFRTPYLDNDIVGLAFRAPAYLRTTPAPALRFVRRNSAALSRIPTDRGLVGERPTSGNCFNHLLAEASFKFEYHTNEGLPNALSSFDGLFKKLGSFVGSFGRHKYLFYRSWLRNELANYVRAGIDQATAQKSPFWNASFVRQLGDAHINGRKNYLRELNAVLTLEAIERLFFRTNHSSDKSIRNLAAQEQALVA